MVTTLICRSSIFKLTGSSLMVLMVLLSGCSNVSRNGQENTQIESVASSKVPVTFAPVLYAVFDDKSGSVKTARISPITEHDLTVLIDSLRLTGGELAFGLIGESTDRPLLRVRVPAPPAKPVKSEVQNAFERAEQDARFQDQMDQYEAEMRRWKEEVEKRINAFIEAVRPRLQERTAAKSSPINTALARSELFLNEPSTTWSIPPRRYIILNSDAKDTTKTKLTVIKSGATLMLINGSGSLGILESMKPLRFESMESAVDYISKTELRRNK
jgi:hypothetical protein